MINQNPAKDADEGEISHFRNSAAYEFLCASLPNVLSNLGKLGNTSDSVNSQAIVQQLIEHRLALPYYDVLAHWPYNRPTPTNASIGLLKLAAQLQHKHQPGVNEAILADVLLTLNTAGVATLIIKGIAHGRAFYPAPKLRRSTDHDILVAPEHRKLAHDALCASGFKATSARVFHANCGQASYRKSAFGKQIEIDLHWELGNNFALYQKFDFQSLINEAIKVDLGTFQALRMSDYNCALHCALNYCSDHPTQRSYLALLDLALITCQFTQNQKTQLVALANKTQTFAVLQFALIAAEKLFGFKLLQLPVETLFNNDPLLRALEDHSKSSEVWWRITSPRPIFAKIKYLWFQALPPKSYMQARYVSKSSVLILYFKRLIYAIRGAL